MTPAGKSFFDLLRGETPVVSVSQTADELDGLRRFLSRLEANQIKLGRRGDEDETAREIAIVRSEIARLEQVQARYSAKNEPKPRKPNPRLIPTSFRPKNRRQRTGPD
jgi:hypothetical protein